MPINSPYYEEGGKESQVKVIGGAITVRNPDGSQIGSSSSSSLVITPTTYSIVVANGATNQSANISQNGLTTELIIVAPSINGSGATYQVDILNAAGVSIFSQSGYTESATTRIIVSRNIISTDTIKITTSITVGADKTFSVQIR